jgi:hypothetical protein
MRIKVLDAELRDYFEFETKDIVSISKLKVHNPNNTFKWWRGPRYEYYDVRALNVWSSGAFLREVGGGVKYTIFHSMTIRVSKSHFDRLKLGKKTKRNSK